MPSSALDIVSLERMKLELRFPEDDNDHDEFLKELIKSAVQFVTADLGVPLVDDFVSINVTPEGQYLIIRDEYAIDLVGIRTQGENAIEGYYPNLIDDDTYLFDSPAVASWIKGVIVVTGTWQSNRIYRCTYIRGISDEDISKYQPLVVLMTRALYNGENMSGDNTAYARLRSAFNNYTYTGL